MHRAIHNRYTARPGERMMWTRPIRFVLRVLTPFVVLLIVGPPLSTLPEGYR